MTEEMKSQEKEPRDIEAEVRRTVAEYEASMAEMRLKAARESAWMRKRMRTDIS